MESKRWKPNSKNVDRRLKRIYRLAFKDMVLMIDRYDANIIYAELKAGMKSEQSRIAMHHMGVKLIGD